MLLIIQVGLRFLGSLTKRVIIQQLNFGVVMPAESFSKRDLQILEHIENNPDVTQSTLAESLGVAVGTVNFVVKRMVKKGYIRVKQLGRRRLKYLITPEGIALRTKLAMVSIQYSMQLYRETRLEAQKLLAQVRKQGYDSIRLEGDGDLAEVVRLTCIEQGVTVTRTLDVPIIQITGAELTLELPEKSK